jgi:hypothetical protein
MKLEISSLFMLVAVGCTGGGSSGNATWTTADTSMAQGGKAEGFWFDSQMNGVAAFDTGVIALQRADDERQDRARRPRQAARARRRQLFRLHR